MAVTVVITRGDSGEHQTKETYPEGYRYVIVDSNLEVYDVEGQLLGTHGSGNWLNAFYDDKIVIETVKPAEDDSSDDFSFGDDSDSSDSSDDFSFGDDDADSSDTDPSDTDPSDTDATDSSDEFSFGDDTDFSDSSESESSDSTEASDEDAEASAEASAE